MGQTRVIYSDATTAEAASILKSCGFLESGQGGLYTSPNIPIKIYVVWGKSSYFPGSTRENVPELVEVTLGAANGLRGNSPGTRVKVFNADNQEEVEC